VDVVGTGRAWSVASVAQAEDRRPRSRVSAMAGR